jgi:hypothetical protein
MNRLNNKELPAFPISEEATDRLEEGVDIYYGLSKREYFAAKAMQAMISNPNVKRPSAGDKLKDDIEKFSNIAVEYADGLISALENER